MPNAKLYTQRNLLSTKKGGGRRILQGEDSKVKTQKIDQIQFWKDIDQIVIYNMELMCQHGSLKQTQTS